MPKGEQVLRVQAADTAIENGNPINAPWPSYNQQGSDSPAQDHFIRRNGIEYAGSHIIIDLWGAQELDNLALMEATLRRAVDTCGATLLHIHLHHFTPNGGISGVAVLAESHISVHTWPERGYAAFDVFMCGDAEPMKSVAEFEQAFRPARTHTQELVRGRVQHD